jgi:hypothetical protein
VRRARRAHVEGLHAIPASRKRLREHEAHRAIVVHHPHARASLAIAVPGGSAFSRDSRLLDELLPALEHGQQAA